MAVTLPYAALAWQDFSVRGLAIVLGFATLNLAAALAIDRLQRADALASVAIVATVAAGTLTVVGIFSIGIFVLPSFLLWLLTTVHLMRGAHAQSSVLITLTILAIGVLFWAALLAMFLG